MPEEPKRVINTQSYFEQGVHAHTHHYAAKQNLAEAAAEIQQLLNHLAQTYPTTTEPEQQFFSLSLIIVLRQYLILPAFLWQEELKASNCFVLPPEFQLRWRDNCTKF